MHRCSRSTSVSLPSIPNWLPVLPLADFEVSVGEAVVPGVLYGMVAKADCQFQPVGVPFSFPVVGVAPQGVSFELLECCGEFQRHKLVLDVLSKSSIELTIESHIIPTRVCCMFGKLDHVFVHMLVILHFKCTKSTFGSLGEIGLPKEDVQLFHKLTPIAADRGLR